MRSRPGGQGLGCGFRQLAVQRCNACRCVGRQTLARSRLASDNRSAVQLQRRDNMLEPRRRGGTVLKRRSGCSVYVLDEDDESTSASISSAVQRLHYSLLQPPPSCPPPAGLVKMQVRGGNLFASSRQQDFARHVNTVLVPSFLIHRQPLARVGGSRRVRGLLGDSASRG